MLSPSARGDTAVEVLYPLSYLQDYRGMSLMSESEKSTLDHLLSRRVFVKTSTVAAAVGLLGASVALAAEEPAVVALTM